MCFPGYHADQGWLLHLPAQLTLPHASCVPTTGVLLQLPQVQGDPLQPGMMSTIRTKPNHSFLKCILEFLPFRAVDTPMFSRDASNASLARME